MGSTTIPGGGGRDGDHNQGYHVYGGGVGQGWAGWIGHGAGGGGTHAFTGYGGGTNHLHPGADNGGGRHDTINLGSGHDTLVNVGHASVHGAMGARFEFGPTSHGATLAGGSHTPNFVHTAQAPVAHHGGTGHAALPEHTGAQTLFASVKIGSDVIRNFASGNEKLVLEGKSLSYLPSHNNVSVNHGGAVIHLDGGSTTVSLKGISHNVVGHK
jgi:hypothetical protein